MATLPTGPSETTSAHGIPLVPIRGCSDSLAASKPAINGVGHFCAAVMVRRIAHLRPGSAGPERHPEALPGPRFAPNLNAQSVTFAWTSAGAAGRPVVLTVTFLDGTRATASATYNVSSPTAQASADPRSVILDAFSKGFPGRPALYFAILFLYGNHSAAPAGDYQWVQVIKSSVSHRHNVSTGQTQTLSLSGLDSTYPCAPLNTKHTLEISLPVR
jgi:hypothetical protein